MSNHHDHDSSQRVSTDEEATLTYYQALEVSIRELMISKGAFSAADVRKQIEMMDSRSPVLGSRVVARAWVDGAFKDRLLTDANAACGELGITVGEANLVVVENTSRVHNVIVCTLCSCYPRAVLGYPPDWYKSKVYRSQVVREPRKVLAEFGTLLPDNVAVKVHDSTAEKRYLVLPLRPTGTDSMTEGSLSALVTRDSMIGVAFAAAPDSSTETP